MPPEFCYVISMFLFYTQVLDTWLAYAPVKNNPEDAAKVKLATHICDLFEL